MISTSTSLGFVAAIAVQEYFCGVDLHSASIQMTRQVTSQDIINCYAVNGLELVIMGSGSLIRDDTAA